MACLKRAGLQEYLEESEPSALRRIVESRLTACARCRATFGRVLATHRRVNAWLGRLSPSAAGMEPDAGDALTRVICRLEAEHLFVSGPEIPSYKSIASNLREILRPEKLPPLELTSTPVAVKDIWGQGTNPMALASSIVFQTALVALLLMIGTSPSVRTQVMRMTLIAPPVAANQPKPAHPRSSQGGGGQRSPLPPVKGQLPKPALRVFTPPLATIEHPALVMDASLISPPDAWAVPTDALGNPLGITNGGGGPGTRGGLGNGDGTSIGDRSGDGFGRQGGPDVFTVGGGISAPSVLSKVDPEYSEEARKAKYSGAVMLSIVVNTDGRAEDIKVLRSLGMGLDEKAVDAVRKWRFLPGRNKGVPVRVRAQIEVNFRLL
jgi:TonB family protein